jgi:hypothetical protein
MAAPRKPDPPRPTQTREDVAIARSVALMEALGLEVTPVRRVISLSPASRLELAKSGGPELHEQVLRELDEERAW